jgi:hypothetical protein
MSVETGGIRRETKLTEETIVKRGVGVKSVGKMRLWVVMLRGREWLVEEQIESIYMLVDGEWKWIDNE